MGQIFRWHKWNFGLRVSGFRVLRTHSRISLFVIVGETVGSVAEVGLIGNEFIVSLRLGDSRVVIQQIRSLKEWNWKILCINLDLKVGQILTWHKWIFGLRVSWFRVLRNSVKDFSLRDRGQHGKV